MTGAGAAEGSAEEASAVAAQTFGCGSDLAAIIAGKARIRDYRPRATIAAGETPVEHVHLVVGGHARMMATALEGRRSVIEDYHQGDLFGEQGLFGAASLPHDVVAVRQSRIGAFANGDFLGLMNNYAAVGLAVSRLLVTRLHHAQRRLAEGATLSVRGRVCAELLRLARAGEVVEPGLGHGLRIAPPPVLAQLALSVDSTRESVSRTISLLERRGLIERHNDALLVTAPHRLEELVY